MNSIEVSKQVIMLPYVIINKILTYISIGQIHNEMELYYRFKQDKFRKIYNYPNSFIMFDVYQIPEKFKFFEIKIFNCVCGRFGKCIIWGPHTARRDKNDYFF